MDFNKMTEEQIRDNPNNLILLVVLSAIFSGEVRENDNRGIVEDSSEN